MSARDRSAKDKAMAAYLRSKHVIRTTGNCPMCHHTVGLERAMVEHIRLCLGRRAGRW